MFDILIIIYYYSAYYIIYLREAMKVIGLLLGLAIFSMLFATEFKDITGVGSGETEESSLSQAKRNALETSVGVFLSSKSIVDNYSMISDNIISKSNGFIKNYRVLKSGKREDGLFETEISASITDVVDQIVQDELALKLLLTEMKLPSFAVMVYDNENKRDVIAESSVKKYLMGKGLKLKHIDIEEPKIADLKQEGINFLLKGKSDYAFISLEGVYNIQTMRSLQATINLELIDCGTKDIISTHTVNSKQAHISENTARKLALEQCGPQIAAYILNQAVGLWSEKLTK